MSSFQPEPDGEDSYVNALLTTLAKGPGRPVTLVPGKGVPPLAPLAEDPEELDWIASLPFKYDELDATEVIATILTLAGWRFYHLWKTTYELKALLALPGGRESHVRFIVERVSRFPAAPIIVTKAP